MFPTEYLVRNYVWTIKMKPWIRIGKFSSVLPELLPPNDATPISTQIRANSHLRFNLAQVKKSHYFFSDSLKLPLDTQVTARDIVLLETTYQTSRPNTVGLMLMTEEMRGYTMLLGFQERRTTTRAACASASWTTGSRPSTRCCATRSWPPPPGPPASSSS